MTRNTPLTWKLGIASLSLLSAVAVYCFARFYPPEVLEPFQIAGTGLASYTGIFGSAPSFFYTLALCLIIGACTSNRSTAILHCFLWIGLSLGLELTQHPTFAGSLSTWLPRVFPESAWRLIGPYYTRRLRSRRFSCNSYWWTNRCVFDCSFTDGDRECG